MSSRLFLNIRERLGLAYDVTATRSTGDTGYLGVYIGVDPKKAIDAVNAAMAELRALSETAVTPDELARQEFTKGACAWSLRRQTASRFG